MEQAERERFSGKEQADLQRRQRELSQFADDIAVRQQDQTSQLRREPGEVVGAVARRLLNPLIDRLKREFTQEPLAGWIRCAVTCSTTWGGSRKASRSPPTCLRSCAPRADSGVEYRVNVVVDNSRTRGAPVIVETAPTYQNPFGLIEAA